jgi:hypothetical protein
MLYGERLDAHGKPGTITFDSVQLSVLGIGSLARDTIVLRGKGRFMKAGLMSLDMKIPMSSRSLSFSYSGSLTGMDLTVMNRFLETAEHTRITSGTLTDATFAVRFAHGRGSGTLKANYKDLYLTLLDKKTGSAIVFEKQIATLFANLLQIRGSNIPDKSGSMKIGVVNYTRRPTDTFMNVVWFSLRSGVGNVVGF